MQTQRHNHEARNAGQAKKSDCVCPKKPAPRGKKKSKLPKTDEPLEAIESRFLGEDEDQRELEACRERKGELDEEAARLKRELAETRAAQAAAPPAAPEKKKPKKRPPKKAFEVGSIVDAAAAAFGPQYVEAARNGGPKKFRGVIVATPPNSDHWNVEYVDDGETPCGLFMGCANSGAILGSNFVFLLAQVSWVVVTCSIVLYVIKRQIGLRVNLDDEVKGLDQSQHGGRSYTEFQTTVFKFKTASGAEHSMEMRVRAGDAAKFAMALSEVMEGAAGGVADVGPDDSVKGAKISRVFINNQPVESESESDYGSSQHSKGSRGESLRAASVFAQMGIQPVPTSSSAGAGGDVVLNMPPSALKPVREEWRSSPDDSPSRDEAEMKKKKKREKRSDGRGRNGVPLDPFADAQNAV